MKREVAKAEADAEQVRTRKTRDEARLASGQGSAKDLEHLQHELVSLTRRVNDLEEIELEIMMRLDEITSKANFFMRLTPHYEQLTSSHQGKQDDLRSLQVETRKPHQLHFPAQLKPRRLQ